jgi:hypothetical protein
MNLSFEPKKSQKHEYYPIIEVFPCPQIRAHLSFNKRNFPMQGRDKKEEMTVKYESRVLKWLNVSCTAGMRSPGMP